MLNKTLVYNLMFYAMIGLIVLAILRYEFLVEDVALPFLDRQAMSWLQGRGLDFTAEEEKVDV